MKDSLEFEKFVLPEQEEENKDENSQRQMIDVSNASDEHLLNVVP